MSEEPENRDPSETPPEEQEANASTEAPVSPTDGQSSTEDDAQGQSSAPAAPSEAVAPAPGADAAHAEDQTELSDGSDPSEAVASDPPDSDNSGEFPSLEFPSGSVVAPIRAMRVIKLGEAKKSAGLAPPLRSGPSIGASESTVDEPPRPRTNPPGASSHPPPGPSLPPRPSSSHPPGVGSAPPSGSSSPGAPSEASEASDPSLSAPPVASVSPPAPPVAPASTSVPPTAPSVPPVAPASTSEPPTAPSAPHSVPSPPSDDSGEDVEEVEDIEEMESPAPPQLDVHPPVPPTDRKPPPPRRTAKPALPTAKKPRKKPWWETLFGDDFSRAYRPMTQAQLSREVDFMLESLQIPKGAVILDLGCGQGEICVELSRRGYSVVGYDLSVYQLAMAGDNAQQAKQKINFLQGDMREMAFDQMFDAVICWDTTFGYFEEDKNLDVLQRVKQSLKPQGRLLIDVMNRDFAAREAPYNHWFEGDGCVCMDDMSLDWITNRLKVKRSIILDDGRSKELQYSTRLYTLSEVGRMLHDVGFRVAAVSGDVATKGAFFGPHSRRIIIQAGKP